MTLLIVVYLILTLFLITVREFIDNGGLTIFGIRAIFVVMLCICVFTYHNAFVHSNYQFWCFLTFVYGMIPSLLQAYYSDSSTFKRINTNNEFPTIQLLEQALIYITASNLSVFSFSYIIFVVIIQNVLFFVFYGLQNWLTLDFCIFWISLNIFVLMKNYS